MLSRKSCTNHWNTCDNHTCIINPLPNWVKEASQICSPVPSCTTGSDAGCQFDLTLYHIELSPLAFPVFGDIDELNL